MKRKILSITIFVGVLSVLAVLAMAAQPAAAQNANPLKQLANEVLEGGINSLSGSFVEFDPSVGGDDNYIPGATQTFCFRAESFTNDYEYVYNVWQRFPDNWTVNDVYVQGTPVCDGGAGWGAFSWSYHAGNLYEINVSHTRNQAPTDHCTTYYCFDVVSGAGAGDAPVSWYWYGDGYGNPPHWPCSDDGYTPSGQSACDEMLYPPAMVPLIGYLDGHVYDAMTAAPIEGAFVDPPGEATDANGYYTGTLSVGTYTVTATHPWYTTAITQGVEIITDQLTTVDFYLVARGLLWGYVSDYDSGAPLEGVLVEADDGSFTTTGADGYYEMYLDEGTYALTATMQGYVTGMATVDILSGADTQQDFALMAEVVFMPSPLHATVDWGSTYITEGLVLNRLPMDYDFEFLELTGGFMPTLMSELAWNVFESGEAKGLDVDEPGEGWIADSGGPDPFGYTFMDSNEPAGPTFEWIEISGTGQDLGLTDDSHVWPLALPFTFNFYGVDYTQIAVGSNGTVYFEDIYLGLGNCGIPCDPGYGVLTFIAGYWDDLNPSAAGAVYYEALNYNGVDIVVVEWIGVPIYGTSDLVTYEIILFPNGSALIQYLDPSSQAGSSATVGIQGDISTGLGYLYNQANLEADLAICFTYPGSPGCLFAMDVPWFAQDPITGTVPASTTLPGELYADMIFTATLDAGVDQPGDYYATLLVSGDPSLQVPVTMTVVPAADMGQVHGYITDNCLGDPLEGVWVGITPGGNPISETWSLADGYYSAWLYEGSYDLVFDNPGYISYTTSVSITGGGDVWLDVSLVPDRPCVDVYPDEFEVWVLTGTMTYTHPSGLNIFNDGGQDLDFEIEEQPGGFTTTPGTLYTVNAPATTLNLDPAAKGSEHAKAHGPREFTLAAGLPLAGPYDVLLVSPDSTGGDISLLLATLGAFPDLVVTVWDNTMGNPTPADMAPYDVIFVGNDVTWESQGLDKVAIGNALADYIDGGGKAIESLYVQSFDQWGFGGRYMTDGYSPFTVASLDNWNPDTLNILEPGHPVMAGVASIGDNWGHQDPGLAAGATLLASWNTTGYSAVAVNDDVVALNQLIFAAADWTGDVGTLLHNAIVWLAGEAVDVPWIWEDPVAGTVPALDMFYVDIMFTAVYSDLTPMELGTYTATLVVNSNDPVADAPEIPVTMHIVEEFIDPAPSFESNAPLCFGETAVFTNTSVEGVPPTESYTWDFGDGFGDVGENASHTYAAAGTYTVTLTAHQVQTGVEVVYTDSVEVKPLPVADFTYTVDGLTVDFTSTSVNATTFTWDFGDGFGDVGENVSHTYAAPGDYLVSLTVYGDCGVDQIEMTVTATYHYIYLPIVVRE